MGVMERREGEKGERRREGKGKREEEEREVHG